MPKTTTIDGGLSMSPAEDREDAPDIGQILRQLRRRDARRRSSSERTYRDLAAATGWSVAAIGDYFTGKTVPPTDRFDVLVRLLGATPAEQGTLATVRDQVEERQRAGTGSATPAVARLLGTSMTATTSAETVRPDNWMAPQRDPGAAIVVPPTPAQLPPELPDFIGRAEHLKRLFGMLRGLKTETPASTTLVITGPAGAGKSALAVHFAYRVVDRFPDGQLYIDMRTHSHVPPLSQTEAIVRLLRSLGVPPGQIPSNIDEAAATYRSLTAERRLLLLIDDAASAEHVRCLLPGKSRSVVIVTSRNRLTGLMAREGANRLVVGAFTPRETRTTLARMLGRERVNSESQAATELGVLCCHIPLAVRVAGANLSGTPNYSLSRYVAELRHGDRLSALTADDDRQSALRAALDLSYRRHEPKERRIFRLLSLIATSEVSAAAVAAVADVAIPEAECSLKRLASTYLIEQSDFDLFTISDLVYIYSCECSRAEDDQRERIAAKERLSEWRRTDGAPRGPAGRDLSRELPRAYSLDAEMRGRGLTLLGPSNERP